MKWLTALGFALIALLPACGEQSGDESDDEVGGAGGENSEDNRPPSSPGTECVVGTEYKSACATKTEHQLCTEGVWSPCIQCEYGLLEQCDDGQIHCWDAGSSPCGVPVGGMCAEPGSTTGCATYTGQQLCLSSNVWSECITCSSDAELHECEGGEIVCAEIGGPACPE